MPAAFAPAPVIAPAPVAVDIGAVAVAGEKCVDKIITVEEIESEDQVECKHRYDGTAVAVVTVQPNLRLVER